MPIPVTPHTLSSYVEVNFIIVFSEHWIFRGGNFATGYDLDGWNDPARLPLGLAACTSFLLGVVGWVMGMSQTWFVGPVAKKIGGTGDVGNELTLVITLVTFIPLRFLEKRIIGR